MRAWARQLMSPSSRLGDSGLRGRSSLLAALLLFMFGWTVVMLLALRFLVTPGVGWANPEFPLGVAFLLLLMLAYVLNRRGYYLSAAVLMVGTLLIAIFAGLHLSLTGLMEPYYGRDEVHILSYLLLPVVFGVVLLQPRLVALTIGLMVAGVLLVPLRYAHVSWDALLYGPLLYVVMVSALLLFLAYAFNALQERQFRTIRESEARYRGLFEQSLDAVYTASYDGSQLEVNQAWLDLYGYCSEEVPHLNATDIYAEPAARLDFLSHIEETGFVKDEVRFKKKDGSVILCQRHVVALRDESGRIVEFQGVLHDVTERKQAERELRESEQRYRLIADDTVDVIWRMDMDMRFTYVNPAIVPMFGYQPEEWIGTSLADHCSQEAFEVMYTLVVGTVEHLSEHTGVQFDTVMYGRDGVEFPVEIRAKILTDEEKRPYAIHGMTRDITERKKAERDLRDSEEKYRELFEESMDAICVVARDGTLIEANPAYLFLYGLDASDIGKFNVRNTYLAPGVREDFLDRMEVSGAVFEEESKRRKKDGTIIDVLRSARALRDTDGRIVALQAFSQDITSRKKAEESLLRSEKKYRMLFEQSFDAVAVFDVDGTLLDANPAHLNMFGLRTDDIGKNVVSQHYISLADRDKFLRVVARDGSIVDQEVRLQKRDGTPMDCVRTGVGRFDDEGQLISVQTVTRDITAQKRAQQQVRESEEKYRLLFEMSVDPVALVSVDGTVLDANRAWLTVHGYEPGDIGKVSVIDGYVDPAEREQVLRQLDADGVIIDTEVVRKKKDGTLMHCQFSAVAHRDAEGRIVAMQTVSRDITERKRAEDELRDSELRFRSLVEHTGLGMTVTRPDSTIIDCNDVFLQMMGYTREEFMTLRTPDLYVDARDRDRVRDQVVRDGYVRDEVLEFKRKDGTPIFVSLTAAIVPFHGEQGIVSQWLDITERKMAEREAIRSREELQRLTIQLQELTAYLEEAREQERTGIARELHDQLGQALTALKLDIGDVARRVMEHRDVPPEKLAAMSTLLDETAADVRRISSELRPGVLDDLGLAAALDWQLSQFRERTGLVCELVLLLSPDDMDLREKQSTALFRVFQELLTNVARHAQATRVTVDVGRQDAQYVLTVADDGIGVTRENLESPDSLGLIGMRERVRPLGGDIDISSTPGKGTVVRVSLPAN